MNFILDDLGGVNGSLAHVGLIIRTFLTQQNVERLVQKYVMEYVQCHSCKNVSSVFEKDKKRRTWNIICSICHADRGIDKIKGG